MQRDEQRRRTIGDRTCLAICVGVALLVASCDRDGPSGEQPGREELADEPHREYCGGELPEGAVAAYFDRLARHLERSDEPVPLDFYADVVTLTEGGRTLSFRVKDVGPQAERLPTLADWREISRRGEGSLHPAGYRGCFFSAGKAWFETNYPDGRFALSGFDKDMPWASDE